MPYRPPPAHKLSCVGVHLTLVCQSCFMLEWPSWVCQQAQKGIILYWRKRGRTRQLHNSAICPLKAIICNQQACVSWGQKEARTHAAAHSDLEEELHSVLVELQGDGLQQVDIVSQHLVIIKVVAQGNYIIDVVVGEEVENSNFAANILDQD